MPKAFLLKYKKRCEYFGRRSDDENSICENPIDLMKSLTPPDEKDTITGRKPLLYLY